MLMFEKLKHIYYQQQFSPGVSGVFINPFYFARKGLYRHISHLMPKISGRVLDIGCGKKPYQHLSKASQYIGLELDTPQNRYDKNADYFYDGIRMPFDDDSFDCLVANQVFEHVFNPSVFLKEANRVLKPNGHFLLTCPFIWDEHEQPFDYARYSSFGLKHVLQECGFSVIEQKKSATGIEAIFQMINCHIYKITATGSTFKNALICILLMAPLNITGLILSKFLPKNDDLYLDNIILVEKIKNV